MSIYWFWCINVGEIIFTIGLIVFIVTDVACENAAGDGVCALYAGQGACETNAVWMFRNCWKSCVQCRGPTGQFRGCHFIARLHAQHFQSPDSPTSLPSLLENYFSGRAYSGMLKATFWCPFVCRLFSDVNAVMVLWLPSVL